MIFREVEDRDLIAKARRGDVEAFNLLVSRWEKRVFNYLLRLLSNREDALDVSQDVFLKAYQNLPKLGDTDRFAGWLFRIAHNEAFSLLRRKRPETDASDDLRRDRSRRPLAAVGAFSGRRKRPQAPRTRISAKPCCSRCIKASSSMKSPRFWIVPVSTVKSRLYTALDLLKAVLAPSALRRRLTRGRI